MSIFEYSTTLKAPPRSVLPMASNDKTTESHQHLQLLTRNADETVSNVSDSHDFITDVYCYDLQGATKGWNLEIWKYSGYDT